jgi:hypothetical protein
MNLFVKSVGTKSGSPHRGQLAATPRQALVSMVVLAVALAFYVAPKASWSPSAAGPLQELEDAHVRADASRDAEGIAIPPAFEAVADGEHLGGNRDGFDFIARTREVQAAFGSARVVFAVPTAGAERRESPEFSGLPRRLKEADPIWLAQTMEFRGTAGVRPTAEEPLPGVANYLIGNDPSRWRLGVHRYGQIRYSDLWPGIDLVFYFDGGRIRYDFYIRPGGDPRSIKLAFPGQTATLDDEENLVVSAPNSAALVHTKPIMFQNVGGLGENQGDIANLRRVEVTGGFLVESDSGVSFFAGAYDETRELVIDPVVLNRSTYLGGSTGPASANDYGRGIAVDSSGSVYVAGSTESADFPTQSPSIQRCRVAVTALSPSFRPQAPHWSTRRLSAGLAGTNG